MRNETDRARRATRHVIGVLMLLVLWGSTSCGRWSDDVEPPDMTGIRGDPIEPLEEWVDPMDIEAATAIEEVPEREWWGEGAADEPLMVSFDQLASFQYRMPERPMEGAADLAAGDEQIPPSIRSLDGRLVGVKGFMLPTRLEGGMTTEFLLMRDQSMCCFGVIPQINEWVEVIMEGRGVRPLMDQPVTVFGRMRVGAAYEGGVLVGIYRMEGEDLAGPLDL
jgi:hypothetical protein